MIARFTDHSANERTFLAWVRTAIAMMSFGIFLSRFDLAFSTATPAIPGSRLAGYGHTLGSISGPLLVFLGAGTMVLAVCRYRKIALDIDDCRIISGGKLRTEVASFAALSILVSALLVFTACFL